MALGDVRTMSKAVPPCTPTLVILASLGPPGDPSRPPKLLDVTADAWLMDQSTNAHFGGKAGGGGGDAGGGGGASGGADGHSKSSHDRSAPMGVSPANCKFMRV